MSYPEISLISETWPEGRPVGQLGAAFFARVVKDAIPKKTFADALNEALGAIETPRP